MPSENGTSEECVELNRRETYNGYKEDIDEQLTDVLCDVPSKGVSFLKPWLPITSPGYIQEYKIETPYGCSLNVAVQGDRNKPAILTYHDIGLNHVSQFQHFFSYQDMSIMCKHFCVYHIDAPGQEENAGLISYHPKCCILPTSPSPQTNDDSLPTNNNGNGGEMQSMNEVLSDNTFINDRDEQMIAKDSGQKSTDQIKLIESGQPSPGQSCKTAQDGGRTGQGVKKSISNFGAKNRDYENGNSIASRSASLSTSSVGSLFSSLWNSFGTNQNTNNTINSNSTVCAYPTMDELADMITCVIKRFNIASFVGFGVGAGANILSRYALKNPNRVEALFLLNANCNAAGWSEWGYQKLNTFYLRKNSLTNFTHEYLLWHHFGKMTPEKNSDLINAFREYFMSHINNQNLAGFIDSYVKRSDLSLTRTIGPDYLVSKDGNRKTPLKNFDCQVMIIVGNESPHLEDCENMFSTLEPNNSAWLKVSNCGGMVLEEKPDKVAEAFRLFLQGLGYIPHLNQEAINHTKRNEFAKYRSLSTNTHNLTPNISCANPLAYRNSVHANTIHLTGGNAGKVSAKAMTLPPIETLGSQNIHPSSVNANDAQRSTNLAGVSNKKSQILKVIDVPDLVLEAINTANHHHAQIRKSPMSGDQNITVASSNNSPITTSSPNNLPPPNEMLNKDTKNISTDENQITDDLDITALPNTDQVRLLSPNAIA